MGLVDVARQDDLVLVEANGDSGTDGGSDNEGNSSTENQHKNTAPFVNFLSGLIRFEATRVREGRKNEPISPKDWLAARNVVEPLLREYTHGTTIIPWIKERLNPYRPDSAPCHRLELEHVERRHNWRDVGADVAAIPYAPPLAFMQNLPGNLYEGPRLRANPMFFNSEATLESAVFECIYERGIDHLWRLAEYDEDYRLAIKKINELHKGNEPEYQAKVMVTWAIDSAITGVDVHRVAKHAGSIEAICGDNVDVLDIPNINKLNEMAHDARTQLNSIYEALAEMADNSDAHVFSNYDERSVKLFMQVRSIVDTCRWYIERKPNLTRAQKDILNKTLVDAYKTYHSVVQTCGSREVDDIRSQAHRDVSVLLAGNKVDVGVVGGDVGCIDVGGEEDYLGAFMAAASYDEISEECCNKMLHGFTIRTDSHGGARSYFGTFEVSGKATLRQQLTLMCVIYYRMPEWQREKYKDLIHTELANKLDRAMEVSTNKLETALLYVPTQDIPVEVGSLYEGGFDWASESEIHGAQHMMPIMDLVANYPDVMKQLVPRISIKPGNRQVMGLNGAIDLYGNFLPFVEGDESEAKEPDVPPVYENMLFALKELNIEREQLEGTDDDYFIKTVRYKKRKIIEQFIRERTTEKSTIIFPWLEGRLNAPPMDFLPSHTQHLPTDFLPNTWEVKADHAIIPHIPSRDYLLNPPNNLWQDPGEDDVIWSDIKSSGIEEIVIEEIRRIYGEDEELVDLLNNHEQVVKLYWTWANDTRIDGVDINKSYLAQEMLQRCAEEGRVLDVSRYNFDKTKQPLELVLPGDLLLASKECEIQLREILADISVAVEAGEHRYGVHSYEERVFKLRDNLVNVINMTRWHIEHSKEALDDPGVQTTRESLTEAFQNSYLTYNTMLQTCNMYYDKGSFSGHLHEISALIGGYKVDQTADGRYEQTAVPNHDHDYVDAFMAVAHSRHVAKRYNRVVGGLDQVRTKIHEGGRALLGTFQAQAESSEQQLVLLGVLYQRMPSWQKIAYKDLIYSEFAQLSREIHNDERLRNEKQIFIPSASKAKLKYPEHYPFDFNTPPFDLVGSRLELVRAGHILPITNITTWMPDDYFSKSNGGMEIRQNGIEVKGFGSGNCWVDELGFLHPGFEKKVAEQKPDSADTTMLSLLEQIGEKKDRWLNNLIEAPSVTVDSRLGKEMAAKIETLLDQSKDNGSVEGLGKLAVILGQLLGRELTESDSKYLEMLKSLGMLNREAIDISGMGEKEIRDMLAFVKTEKPKLEDMDESSLILLFLGAAGVAPRQELVEQIIKAHETTVNIFTLEAVEAIESISKKKRFNLLEFLRIKPKEEDKRGFLTRRDELRSYLSQKRKEDSGYHPETDPEWREMQLSMLKYIVELVHSAKSYDSSADSTLSTVIAAKNKGKFLARCETNGEILTTMLNLGIPEFRAHLTSDYGPEGNLSLEEFLRNLLTAEDSGASSHAYSSTILDEVHYLNIKGQIIVADAESGKVRTMVADRYKFKHADEKTYAVLVDHEYGTEYEDRKDVLHSCVSGGSSITANFANEMGQYDLAEMADPDYHMFNRAVIMKDESFSIERRSKSLRRIMGMYPRMLAMAAKFDYSKHVMINTLNSTIEIGRDVGNWGAAFYAANIMKNAGFLGKSSNSAGANYLLLLAQKLVILRQGQYEAAIKQHSKFLTSSDLELIARSREEYLAELASLSRESEGNPRKLEKELKRKKNVESAREFKSTKSVVRKIINEVRAEENKRKEEDEVKYGKAEGGQDRSELENATKLKVNEIAEETTDPNTGSFEDSRFQLLSPKAQDALLLASVTDHYGNRLEGPDLEERVMAIQALFVKYSHDHAKLTRGGAGSTLMQIGGSSSSLVTGFEEMAVMLNDRLGKAISRTGLQVDVADFNPRLVAENIRKSGVQELLGRGNVKQLAGKIQ